MFQIMVVEDDIKYFEIDEGCFTHAGYEVFAAENGEVALEIMDRRHIDLIVLDVMMPVMDGYDLLNSFAMRR